MIYRYFLFWYVGVGGESMKQQELEKLVAATTELAINAMARVDALSDILVEKGVTEERINRYTKKHAELVKKEMTEKI